MRTGLIPYKDKCFEVNFDFNKHILTVNSTESEERFIELRPQSVAGFYHEFMTVLSSMDIEVKINVTSVEFAETILLDTDAKHFSYDKEFVSDWNKIQIHLSMIFEKFRTPFRGKSSPVHFFWGSFDLNATRFCGRPASPPNYGGKIMQYAENEENFSYGFWPGDARYPHPALYAYMYPAPKGIDKASVEPKEAFFSKELGEFLLPYEEVISGANPEEMVLNFLHSAYEASAKLAKWNVEELHCPTPY
jgi:hypothetical protein